MNFENITVTDISGVVTVCSEKGKYDCMIDRKSYGLSFCSEGQITYIQNGKEYRFGDQFPEPKTGDIYKFAVPSVVMMGLVAYVWNIILFMFI